MGSQIMEESVEPELIIKVLVMGEEILNRTGTWCHPLETVSPRLDKS